MSKWQSIGIPSLLLGVVAGLTAYGILTMMHIRKLEQRRSNAEEQLRAETIRVLTSTNGGFLFDGLRYGR